MKMAILNVKLVEAVHVAIFRSENPVKFQLFLEQSP